jgi:hypothetical protein
MLSNENQEGTIMTISMYNASAPRFVNILKNLSGILDKAQAHCDAKKIDPLVLTSARLFPDMFPLTRQIQIATDGAKGAMARLAGVDIPKFEDTEKTIPELKERIAKTIAFIETIKPAQVDGTEGKEIVLPPGGGGKERRFTGIQFLLGWAHPNFYFHVTTTYNLLRHNGVEIGKLDYLGTPTP